MYRMVQKLGHARNENAYEFFFSTYDFAFNKIIFHVSPYQYLYNDIHKYCFKYSKVAAFYERKHCTGEVAGILPLHHTVTHTHRMTESSCTVLMEILWEIIWSKKCK
jgi:hypothetical protein